MPAFGYSNKNTEHSDCDGNNQYKNFIFYFFRIFFKILFIKNTLNCFTASPDCRTHAKGEMFKINSDATGPIMETVKAPNSF